MKTFVVTIDPGYGQYVYLLKAETEEKAREFASSSLDEYSTIDDIVPLDDYIEETTNDRLLMIGGYAE